MTASLKPACRNPRRIWVTSLCIFEMVVACCLASRAQAGVTFTIIACFDVTNGWNPQADLIQAADGNFYSTTRNGGAYSNGTVFRVTPAGVLSTVHSFDGTNGGSPTSALLQTSNGDFYGTTAGSTTTGAHTTIYRISNDGTFTNLVDYTKSQSNDYTGFPAPLILGMDGNFYGTAYSDQFGSIFRMSPDGTVTNLFYFSPTNGIQEPAQALVQGTNGTLYGVCARGGLGYFGGSEPGWGTVFSITTNGVFNMLHLLGDADGIGPTAALAWGKDGNLYGTTAGVSGSGSTVFRITPPGSFKTLATFTGTSGYAPLGRLVLATDGNFYGTTSAGGPGFGTIFKITSGGALTTLYSFQGATNGRTPMAGLLQAADGRFYGTAWGGGIYDKGMVFRVTIPLAPVMGPITVSNGTVALQWSSVTDLSYQLQYVSVPASTNWINLGPPITATNGIMSASDIPGNDSARFYRVVLLP